MLRCVIPKYISNWWVNKIGEWTYSTVYTLISLKLLTMQSWKHHPNDRVLKIHELVYNPYVWNSHTGFSKVHLDPFIYYLLYCMGFVFLIEPTKLSNLFIFRILVNNYNPQSHRYFGYYIHIVLFSFVECTIATFNVHVGGYYSGLSSPYVGLQ